MTTCCLPSSAPSPAASLRGCLPESITALEAALERRSVKAGKRIFKAGTQCDELFIIRSGTVKLMVPLRKKESYHLATCESGDLIGDMGFIESGTHIIDALAVDDCEVYVLSRERFELLAMTHDDLLFAFFGNIARTLSTRLHATIAELQALRG